MSIRLSSKQLSEIHSHAQRDYPHECCGVLLGSAESDEKVVTATKALENVHDEGHERRYLISARSMYEVERDARAAGVAILGFYHSHPDHPAIPSEYDREWAWPWYSYIIVSVRGGEIAETTCWTLDDDRAAFQPEEFR